MAQTRKTGTGAAEFQALVGSLSYLTVDAANVSANVANLVVGGQGEQVITTVGLTNTVVIHENGNARVLYLAVEGTVADVTAVQTSVRALGGSLAAATVTAGSFRVA
jgi:hypothetical protein